MNRLLGLAVTNEGRISTAIATLQRPDLPKKQISVTLLGQRFEREVNPTHLVVIDSQGNESILDPEQADLQTIDSLPLVESESEQILGIPRRLPSGAIVVPYAREQYPGYWACIITGGDSPLYPRGSSDLSVPEWKLRNSPALTPARN